MQRETEKAHQLNSTISRTHLQFDLEWGIGGKPSASSHRQRSMARSGQDDADLAVSDAGLADDREHPQVRVEIMWSGALRTGY